MRKILLVLTAVSWPANRARGQLISAINMSSGKTPGPCFDTLIVRSEPPNPAGRLPRTGGILYDGSAATEVSFEGASQKDMSHRTTLGVVAIAALGCAAGAFYWLHVRNIHPVSEAISVEAPGFHEPPPAPAPAENRVNAAVPKLPAASDVKRTALPPDPVLPLRSGEVLEFTANVSKVSNVANLGLQIAGRGNFLGKSAWHLQAIVHTENPLRMLFELDDQFDSYSDAGTLASMQYEMRLNERGQKVQSIQRMTASGKEPAPNNASIARVLPGTRDPLGMMQYLRSVDWEKTPQVRSPVYDGRKLYDVRAALAAKAEPVSVPAGKFTATKIEIKVFDNGTELKDSHFALYLDNKSAHTPVLLEAVLPFAVATVELQSAK